ncbi:LOW QUALITY PROTEIN: hypothetical protein RJ640_021577, partial [Escallonia rubra]
RYGIVNDEGVTTQGAAISMLDDGDLKYLKDIIKIDNLKGFRLESVFDTNSYFKNSVLTKTYHVIDEYEQILETKIQWYPGNCSTEKILEKKPKKGSKSSKPVTKKERWESFFQLLLPRQKSLQLVWILMTMLITIQDKIIPHAVSWFTGDAAEDDYEDIGGRKDGDEDEETDD